MFHTIVSDYPVPGIPANIYINIIHIIYNIYIFCYEYVYFPVSTLVITQRPGHIAGHRASLFPTANGACVGGVPSFSSLVELGRIAHVVVVLTLTHRYNALRGHNTGSNISGAEDYLRRKNK